MKSQDPSIKTSRLAVIIASKGRADELGDWIGHMRRQSRKPAVMIWAVHSDDDLPDIAATARDGSIASDDTPLLVVKSKPGSSSQRNAGLAAAPDDIDIVAYFDDDYTPSDTCIERIEQFFQDFPDILGATGLLLADGINSPGISAENALALVADHDAKPATATVCKARYGLYGCNMAYRRAALSGISFDEQLPLYGWQEDIDFSRQVAARGTICWTNAFAGVHRGTKRGRTSGTRFGYSQIANPVYLYLKGTMSARVMMRLMFRNVLANHAKALRPEPWVDRIGRVRGNWHALTDLLAGRLHPSRVVDMAP